MFDWTIGHAPITALALALAWLAGVRVYLTVSGLGLAGSLGWIVLPAALQFVASPWVVGACALLALAEFAVDKVPGLDGLWDLLHTFVRIPVGACLGAAFLSADHRIGGPPLLACAAITLCSHTIKSATRRLINASPEPLSNWSASVAEDLLCVVALILLLARPWLGLGVAVCGSVLVALAAVWSFRALRHPDPQRRMEATA